MAQRSRPSMTSSHTSRSRAVARGHASRAGVAGSIAQSLPPAVARLAAVW
ncbi:MAG TPA: hypothetical protein VH969_20720 [Actinophytocola sp.]